MKGGKMAGKNQGNTIGFHPQWSRQFLLKENLPADR
jgi:hypothetical protein